MGIVMMLLVLLGGGVNDVPNVMAQRDTESLGSGFPSTPLFRECSDASGGHRFFANRFSPTPRTRTTVFTFGLPFPHDS